MSYVHVEMYIDDFLLRSLRNLRSSFPLIYILARQIKFSFFFLKKQKVNELYLNSILDIDNNKKIYI
jgi:hypothetical protein